MHETGNFLSLYGANENEGEPIGPDIIEYLVVEANKYLNTQGKNLPNAESSLKTVFSILEAVFINGKYHLKMLKPETLEEYKEALKAGFSLRKEFFDRSGSTLSIAKHSLSDFALSSEELYQARAEWDQRFIQPRHPQLTQLVEKVDTRNKSIPEIALYLLTSSLKLSDPKHIEKAQSYISTLRKQSLIIRGKLFELLSNEVGAAANPLFITDDQLMSTIQNYLALNEAEQKSVINKTQSQFLQNFPQELVNADTTVLLSQFLTQIDESMQRWMRVQATQTDQLALDEYWKKKDLIFSILPIQAISPDLVEHQLFNQYTEIGAPSLWSDTVELNGVVFPSHKSIQAGLRLFKTAGYQKSSEFTSLKAADNLIKNYYSTKRELENKIRRLQEQRTQVEAFLSENKYITEQTGLYPILELSKKINKQKFTLRRYETLKAYRDNNISLRDDLENAKKLDPTQLKLNVLQSECIAATNTVHRSLRKSYTAYNYFPRIGNFLLDTVPEFQTRIFQGEILNRELLFSDYSSCSTLLEALTEILKSISTQKSGTVALFKLPEYLKHSESDLRIFLLNKVVPRLQDRNDTLKEFLLKTRNQNSETQKTNEENLKKAASDLKSKSLVWKTINVSRLIQQVLKEEIKILSKSVTSLEKYVASEKMLKQIKTALRTGQIESSLQTALEKVDDKRLTTLDNELNLSILTEGEIEQVTDEAVEQTRKLLEKFKSLTRVQSLRFPLDQDPLEFLAEHLKSMEGKEKKLRVVSQEELLRSLIKAIPNNALIPVEKFGGLTLTRILEAITEREALYGLNKTHEKIEASLTTNQELLDQAKMLEKYQEAQVKLETITAEIKTSEEMLETSITTFTNGLLELNLAVNDTEFAQIQSTSNFISQDNEQNFDNEKL